MSSIRYVAIYRPYTHLRLNKEPLCGVVRKNFNTQLLVLTLLGYCRFDVHSFRVVDSL